MQTYETPTSLQTPPHCYAIWYSNCCVPEVDQNRQLWTYSGLGIETRDSAQYRYVGGQLQRAKKPQQIRGLNQNHNHEMKEIFKGAAIRASCGQSPLRDFYVTLLAKGMKPEMRV